MKVITISRQYGSGGEEVADQVCQALEFQQFDKHQITQAALEAGLSEQEIVDYSEENFKVRNFLDRLLRRTGPLVQVRVWKEDPSGVRAPEQQMLSEQTVLMLEQKAIKAAAYKGNMVILGRGGQVILKDQPGVLHVRIEAPMEDRIQRVKTRLKVENQDFHADVDIRRTAQDLLLSHDAASAEYLRQFYGVDWADPFLYHLVLNTGMLSIEKSAQIITLIARAGVG